jgi:formylglycine-generating enzyme required for sulfatase activity
MIQKESRVILDKTPFSYWAPNMRHILFSLVLILLFSVLRGEEPIRTWTSKDGRALEASLIEQSGTYVKLKDAQGREFSLSLSRLSRTDQEYVFGVFKKKKEEAAKLEIFRLPMALSGKGCVVLASLKGDIEVFDNPAEEGFFGGSYVKGVYVEPKPAKGRKPKVGETVEAGGVIITGAQSEAILLLTNGTLATLSENSRVVLDNLWQTPFKGTKKKINKLKEEPSLSKTALELDYGELIVDVKKLKKGSSFQIYSQFGQAGIRGTQFRFNAQANKNTLTVTEGQVDYLDPSRKIFSIGKDKSVASQADESSTTQKVHKGEREKIRNVISAASKTSASYNLKTLSQASQKASNAKKEFVVKSADGLEMIWCEPGSYLGGVGDAEAINELKSSRVGGMHLLIKYSNILRTIQRGFYLGKYEVTQSEYEKVMGTNPSRFKDPRMPVTNLSEKDALEFCTKLNQLESAVIPKGWRFSLPRYDQWLYARKAGTSSLYYWGKENKDKFFKDDAWNRTWVYMGKKISTLGYHRFERYVTGRIIVTLPTGDKKILNRKGLSQEDLDYLNGKYQIVGQYPANPWGFYDMFGNVEEMVFKDPENSNRSFGLSRGGSTSTPIITVHSDWLKPYLRTDELSGFRLVLEQVD